MKGYPLADALATGRKFTSYRWPSDSARPIMICHPPLGESTNCSNYSGYRYYHRNECLPARQREMSDFNFLAVPIEVTPSINT